MLSSTMVKATVQDMHVLIWFGAETTVKKDQENRAK